MISSFEYIFFLLNVPFLQKNGGILVKCGGVLACYTEVIILVVLLYFVREPLPRVYQYLLSCLENYHIL
jgi:hypothetical protein